MTPPSSKEERLMGEKRVEKRVEKKKRRPWVVYHIHHAERARSFGTEEKAQVWLDWCADPHNWRVYFRANG